MTLGERIAAIRGSKGITQAFINRKVGKSSAWLSSIERNERGIDAEDLNKVARLLGVSISIFFDEELNKTLSKAPTGTEGRR